MEYYIREFYKNYFEFTRNSQASPECRLIDAFERTFNDIASFFSIPRFEKFSSWYTEEDIKRINDVYNLLTSDLTKMYPNIRFASFSNMIEEEELNGVEINIDDGRDKYLISPPKFALGKDICMLIGASCSIRDCIDGKYNFLYPTQIIYNSKSVELAKKHVKILLELYSDLKTKYKDKIHKTTYKVSTVFNNKTSGFTLTDTYVKPQVKLMEEDFLINYNSDIPEDKVKEFVNMDKGGIIIFNGSPGCGKSTYLKSLIFKYPDTNFILLPQYILNDQENFRSFLFESAQGEEESIIFIVEDCEKLLIKREQSGGFGSGVLSDILNYTDGIFGDLMKSKFIFTFNTDLNNIDKAVLRPGRLFLRYEFGPLKGENLQKIVNKIGYKKDYDIKKGLTLAELYTGSTQEELQITIENNEKRVGFVS